MHSFTKISDRTSILVGAEFVGIEYVEVKVVHTGADYYPVMDETNLTTLGESYIPSSHHELNNVRGIRTLLSFMENRDMTINKIQTNNS